MLSSKEPEVKQIGTIHNVSDIPLSQQGLKFLLRKCNAIDGDGNRVGEKERQIMYASGLGSVAQAERTEVTLQEENLPRTWFWVILCAMAVEAREENART